MSDKLNLMQKIVEVRKSVGAGFNKDTKSYNYTYVSGDQILRGIRDKMNEHNLLLVPEVDYSTLEWQKHEYENNRGQKKLDFIVQFNMTFTWIDGDDPTQQLKVPWLALGQQSDDIAKAVGTAITYNQRYFLLKFMGLPTDEDDADYYKPTPTVTKSNDGFGTVNFKEALTQPQIKRLFAIANKAGIKKEVLETQVKKEFHCEIKEMNKEQYKNICDRLEAKAK